MPASLVAAVPNLVSTAVGKVFHFVPGIGTLQTDPGVGGRLVLCGSSEPIPRCGWARLMTPAEILMELSRRSSFLLVMSAHTTRRLRGVAAHMLVTIMDDSWAAPPPRDRRYLVSSPRQGDPERPFGVHLRAIGRPCEPSAEDTLGVIAQRSTCLGAIGWIGR